MRSEEALDMTFVCAFLRIFPRSSFPLFDAFARKIVKRLDSFAVL